MNEAIALGLSLAAAFALAVVLSIYRRATNTDLVERVAGMLYRSAPSGASSANAAVAS